MSAPNVGIPELYLAAADFAYEKLGRKAVTVACPDSVFVADLDSAQGQRWKVAINGSKRDTSVEPEGCMPTNLAPYQMAFWWNGWLAGLVSPAGGQVAAHPEGANEDRLIADLRAATRAMRGEA